MPVFVGSGPVQPERRRRGEGKEEEIQREKIREKKKLLGRERVQQFWKEDEILRKHARRIVP